MAHLSVTPTHKLPKFTPPHGTRPYEFADTLFVPTYFADPYSAYQRGSNEHFSGRLRRYLPKGTSFEDLTQAELDEFVHEINIRPRKILGWATPAEVFQEVARSTPHNLMLRFELGPGDINRSAKPVLSYPLAQDRRWGSQEPHNIH